MRTNISRRDVRETTQIVWNMFIKRNQYAEAAGVEALAANLGMELVLGVFKWAAVAAPKEG